MLIFPCSRILIRAAQYSFYGMANLKCVLMVLEWDPIYFLIHRSKCDMSVIPLWSNWKGSAWLMASLIPRSAWEQGWVDGLFLFWFHRWNVGIIYEQVWVWYETICWTLICMQWRRNRNSCDFGRYTFLTRLLQLSSLNATLLENNKVVFGMHETW